MKRLPEKLIDELLDVKQDLLDFLQSAVFEEINNEEDILQLLALIGYIIDNEIDNEDEEDY